MRRILIILLTILLLTSCSSFRSGREPSEEEIEEAREYLTQSIQSAIIQTENTLFTEPDAVIYTLPETYDSYISELTQFRRIIAEYLEAARQLLRGALVPVTDYMYEYASGYEIDNPIAYINEGYFSISTHLEESETMNVYQIFLDYLTQNSSQLDQIFSRASREAEIWRDNLANLALVGQARTASEITPIDLEILALNATEAYFNALAENEVSVRATTGGR